MNSYLNQLPREATHVLQKTDKFKEVAKSVPVPGIPIGPAKKQILSPTPGSASARGIVPLGIGDLLLVRQELIGYKMGEIAHIENVLKSEYMTRIHNRTHETEEILSVETEKLEETEKDLQSTDRFELHKEAQKTIESKKDIQSGVSISASYGPVSVSAHSDFAINQSSSESSNNSSSLAKEVIDHSLSRIMQRTRETRTRRTLDRFEEKNEHGFDNKSGAGHIIGIYRWIDKYYKAKLINYGRRLMLEFVIPEPAAFYICQQKRQITSYNTIERPIEPTVDNRLLRPSDLSRYNYEEFVAKYNVQDVEACPAGIIRISVAFAEAIGTDKNAVCAKTSEKLVIPDGYRCYHVFGEFEYQGYDEKKTWGDCVIGGRKFCSNTATDGLEGVISVSIFGWLTAFHVNFVAVCALKEERRIAWQLKTHAAIMNAYERALSEYNEQIAARSVQAGLQFQGNSPEFNRKIEHEEIKKGALRILTNDFTRTRVGGVWRVNEKFNSMPASDSAQCSEFNVNESIIQGRIVQFFEQAFEWNNITYRFYPYQWSRKDSWDEKFALADTDLKFADFLRAGAARVVIPVHPSYTESVLHYMHTNEIWNGSNPPTLDDPLYVSIVDEIKSDSGGDIGKDLPLSSKEGKPPLLVDEWEVKVPTALVCLQEDSLLPSLDKK